MDVCKSVLRSQGSHVQPGHFKKKRNRVCPAYQCNRVMNVCSTMNSTQGSPKDFSERKQRESGPQKSPFNLKTSTLLSASVEGALLQTFSFSNTSEFDATLQGAVAGASSSTPRPEGVSVEQLYLDFKSLMLIKEDAEEDSGSDLSDSERIPISPSPFTPPDLNLPAERIDPACFDHLFEVSYKESEYYYSDVLPPPFNSWDLQQLAAFLNTDGKHSSRPPPAGHLEKYVNRLLQLEWLQMQTIQNEKAILVKRRPPTAPSNSHNLKSCGKSRSWHNPLPSIMAAHPEELCNFPTSHISSNRKKALHCEESSLPRASEGYYRVANVTRTKPALEMRTSLKKRSKSSKQPLLEPQPSASISRLEGTGNVRPLNNSRATHSNTPPLKGPKLNTNPKKNGMADGVYVPTKQADQKVKRNGGTQSTSKLKQI